MKTGIYGGTFSPPHTGHIGAARAFAEQIELDELIIIPAAIPPHKSVDYSDDPQKRLEMAKIAFGDIKNAEVSDLEMKRGGKSYTVYTLRELAREGRELFLLCGTDMITTLDEWFMPEEIFRLCTPVGIRRESSEEQVRLIEKKLAEYKVRFGKQIPFITAPTVEISSSELRKRIAEGEPTDGFLTPEVEEYIKSQGLYKKGGAI